MLDTVPAEIRLTSGKYGRQLARTMESLDLRDDASKDAGSLQWYGGLEAPVMLPYAYSGTLIALALCLSVRYLLAHGVMSLRLVMRGSLKEREEQHSKSIDVESGGQAIRGIASWIVRKYV